MNSKSLTPLQARPANLLVLAALVAWGFLVGNPKCYGDDCLSAPSGLIAWWRGQSNILESINNLAGTASAGLAYSTGKVGAAFSAKDGNLRANCSAHSIMRPIFCGIG